MFQIHHEQSMHNKFIEIQKSIEYLQNVANRCSLLLNDQCQRTIKQNHILYWCIFLVNGER